MGYIVLGVAKKMISMNVDADVLARFDAWCKAQGRSRTSVVERFMDRQSAVASSGVAAPAVKDYELPAQQRGDVIRTAVGAPVSAPREVAPNFKGKSLPKE